VPHHAVLVAVRLGYETGLGRGMGTRDSGQDTLGTMHTVPEHARRMLTTIWKDAVRGRPHVASVLPAHAGGRPGLAAEFPRGRSGSATTICG